MFAFKQSFSMCIRIRQLIPCKYFWRLCHIFFKLLLIISLLGQCQSDYYIWDYSLYDDIEQTGSDHNKIELNDNNANNSDFNGSLKYMEIPLFFWLFLIMAGIWYLFVFRVLCCDKICGNSDVALGNECDPKYYFH